MNAPTNIQTINRLDGSIEYVVLPYEEYLQLTGKAESLIPNEVVGLVVNNAWTPVRAWREHLGLTQTEVAARLGISQSAFAQQEAGGRLRKVSRVKIAAALGISLEQLDF
ncbi:MAG: helix-turn-helix transcriptional regulator [Paludibacterium sp.]|uniref:helix-turn-helix domain-containing protein n=1 Tax=Paludibacterium sp. TaxID=1917523 RepID=UPI0025D3D41F|nr:helix-turn-helix transcriptional regulator [Paludibacterium sp.]MBV8048963.1 helix-turn-helix transcriptional regulator [Paludibacterium sp.]MBV8646593.1 helix-turn-helix transcriptional regulator [Paludibacterium sp.]